MPHKVGRHTISNDNPLRAVRCVVCTKPTGELLPIRAKPMNRYCAFCYNLPVPYQGDGTTTGERIYANPKPPTKAEYQAILKKQREALDKANQAYHRGRHTEGDRLYQDYIRWSQQVRTFRRDMGGDHDAGMGGD